ncbi:hypothetical protein TSUD_02960 [Trifolium subterraneum]|uniref:Knottin scorpion toxin-like domain-containing protein n=1 Tax=Trifolium subterraneum TaxID=3900 RepID=A0A2Z6MA20_TRISU|nr:hypothetical protein TSUD_02960 [Trifolium subterraneum]
MAHKQNFFMAILIVVLLFSIGMHKTEAGRLVQLKCLDEVICYGSPVCANACDEKGYKYWECESNHRCCCANA